MKSNCLTRESVKSQTAIVVLAYADYESLELALASHAKFTVDSGVPIYILQNGRGTYDTERTCSVGKRYQSLFPETIKVITDILPQKPYAAIKQLFHEELFSKYRYIIKLDDDVMVLTPDWVDKLIDTYIQASKQEGDNLAYVTSLVNNNPYGFKKLVDSFEELSDEYFTRLARRHLVGCAPDDSYNPYRIVPKETIFDGGFGTVWQLPYLGRWIHEKTTMQPEHYIERTRDLAVEEIDSRKRYSINCMMFEKKLWDEVYNGGGDDEHMFHVYCMLNGKKIYANLAVPMVHLAFASQREEIRDMIPRIRDVYTSFLALPFPIALCGDRQIEIENRLRYLEKNKKTGTGGKMVKKLRGGIQCYQEHGLKYTVNRTLVHLHVKK